MNSINKILGANVRKHRKRLRITQDELAERCEKSLGTIQLMETGKVWPEITTLERLAEVLAVPESALFEVPTPATIEEAPAESPPLRELLLALAALDDVELRAEVKRITDRSAAISAASRGEPLSDPSDEYARPRKAPGRAR